VKTSFSDLLVQKVVEKRENIDWKRNLAFASFGFIYLGGVQYALYVPIFGRMFPQAARFAAKPLREKVRDVRGMFQLGAQVILDQCIHHPFMYFPAFYCTKELVMSEKPDFGKRLAEYRENMKDDLIALWKVWVPATIVNFAFMPMWARIPFVAGVSLIWTCILSAMRGGDVVHGEEMAGSAVTGATFKMMEEGLGTAFLTTSVDLDKDLNHFVLSASGPDRPGWVATLSRAVADQGGNVTLSKMARLGNDFIIMMHVAVPPGHKNTLISSLKNSDELRPLNIQATALSRRQTGMYKSAKMGLHVHCSGADRPGMLAAITEKLTEQGLTLENVTTELKMRKNGRRDFVIIADCSSPASWDKSHLNDLVEDFTVLKRELDMDIMDIRVLDFPKKRGTQVGGERMILHG